MEQTALYKALIDKNEEEAVKHLADTDLDFSCRNTKGETLLHIAVKNLKSSKIVQSLLPEIDFCIRDENGDNVVDLLLHNEEFPEDVEPVIEEAVKGRIMGSKKAELEEMLKAGWMDMWMKAEQVEEEKVELKQFLTDLPATVAKIEKLHKAIKDGEIEIVKEVLEDGSLLQYADRTGYLPLHKAVILGQVTIAEHVAKTLPDTLKSRDFMSRTALHHAAGRRDAGHLYQLLTEAGAEDDTQDLNLKTPKEIYENPDILPGEVTANVLMNKLTAPVLTSKKKREAQQEEAQEEKTDEEKPSTTPSQTPSIPKPKEEDPNKPVQMYISPDVRPNPPPTTIDGKYVADHLGNALTLALAEIAERRPWDPIEYLANWLYKYQQNVDYNKRQHELLAEIREEEEAKRREREVREKRRQELQRLQEAERRKAEAAEEERKRKEQEEIQRKVKEAALSQQPGLETVLEDKEEDETPKEKSHKDNTGQTELHKLAAQTNVDLTTLLNMGYSPADRDVENKTARDIAEENKIAENVDAIDNYVQKLVEMEEFDTLQDLLLAGYDKFQVVQDTLNEQTTSLPEETQAFLKQLPELQDNISKVMKAVQTESLDDLNALLAIEKKLITAKDEYGRSPLHIAVLTANKNTVEHLATNYPPAMKCKDNLDRTPLHYANAVSEDLAEILTKHGADALAKDVKQNEPSFYKSNPDDITALKGSLTHVSVTQEADKSETSQQQEVTQQETSQQEAGGEQTQEN